MQERHLSMRIGLQQTPRTRKNYVQRHSGEDAAAVGRSMDKELSKVGLEHETESIWRSYFETHHQGIADATDADTDLILVGSSNRNFIRRVLFGTLIPFSVKAKILQLASSEPHLSSQLVQRFW